MNIHPAPHKIAIIEAAREGRLTKTMYDELEPKALANVEDALSHMPEDVQTLLRDSLRAEVTKYCALAR